MTLNSKTQSGVKTQKTQENETLVFRENWYKMYTYMNSLEEQNNK